MSHIYKKASGCLVLASFCVSFVACNRAVLFFCALVGKLLNKNVSAAPGPFKGVRLTLVLVIGLRDFDFSRVVVGFMGLVCHIIGPGFFVV